MQGGDLDNHTYPRVIYVFEDTVGILTKEASRRRQAHLRLHRWKKAAACWKVDPFMLKVLLDVLWRSPYNVDIATYLDEREAEAVQDHLTVQGVPFGHFYITTLEDMTRTITNRPDVAAVYDWDPSRQFAYGAKGRLANGL